VVLTNFSSVDNYGLFTKTPVTNMTDVKGMKIIAAGANARYLAPLGAMNVRGSLVTQYKMLEAGDADGTIIWPQAAITFKLVEVVPYYLETDFGTGVNKSLTINKEVWVSLPSEVQRVLKEVAVDYRDRVSQAALDLAEKSVGAFVDKGGTITKLSENDRKKWAHMLPNIAQEMATDVEKRTGYPAAKILGAYMDALRAAGETPVRDWDRN